jgi:superfamily I DNA/RNA helicase
MSGSPSGEQPSDGRLGWSVDEARLDNGRSKELPPEEVPEEPDQLLYVGLTRATTELVVIAPPELARRLS